MQKNKNIAVIALGTLLVLFLLFTAALVMKQEAPVVSQQTSLQVPSIALPDYPEQKTQTSIADLKGKLYAINIFASWCPGCIVEMPQLEEMKKHIPIYGIAWKDKPEDLNKLFQQYPNPYEKILMDNKGEMIVALGATGAPETLLVDASGTVFYRYAGALDKSVLEAEILPRLKAAHEAR